ncbi:MFS transporter [Pseudonocardia tropica]|uniref:MFS transporter n=1 Tax=Pseudonocardia tropica TaxID=681289 RepID=A0ABV1JXU1_9PSEU
MSAVVIRSERDVIDFVQAHPTGSARTRILMLIALGSVFGDAYDLSSIGIGIASLRAEMQLTAVQVGMVTSITAVGALVSSLLGGYIADRTGRFKLFIISGVLLVLAPIGAAFAPSYEVLVLWRLVIGIAIGLDMPVAFSFMAELVNTRGKARWMNFWQPASTVAVMGAALVALPVYFAGASDDLWRWTVGLGAVPALVVVVLRLVYAEESPLWAVKHQGLHAAAKILEKSYRVTTVVEADEAKPARDDGYRLSTIFNRKFRARTVLASMVAGMQAMQYYAIGFYLPVIAGLIFGTDLVAIVLATVTVHTFALVAGLLQTQLVERFGLWKLTFIGFVIVAVALVVLGSVGGTVWQAVPLVTVGVVGILMFGHAFGPGPQSKTLAALSYPTEYRGLGTGWAETAGRVGGIIGLFLFPVMLDNLGEGPTMLLLALAPAAAVVTLLLIRWEPAGQDVEDDALDREHPTRSTA